METSLSVLLATAITVAVVHTAAGVDHYVPFIALGKAEGWSLKKVLLWTALCGLGHVGSTILIGALFVALGTSMAESDAAEGVRGNLAAYLLVAVGAAYMIWGLIQRKRGHAHVHVHKDGTVHHHHHDHVPAAPHDAETAHERIKHRLTHRSTFWVLVIIFVLGPCEPLLPLLVLPAASLSLGAAVLVAAVFTVFTVGTMLALVTLGHLGLSVIRLRALERWQHALAGFAVLASGVMILLWDPGVS